MTRLMLGFKVTIRTKLGRWQEVIGVIRALSESEARQILERRYRTIRAEAYEIELYSLRDDVTELYGDDGWCG